MASIKVIPHSLEYRIEETNEGRKERREAENKENKVKGKVVLVLN
jgi:hypothetical protein